MALAMLLMLTGVLVSHENEGAEKPAADAAQAAQMAMIAHMTPGEAHQRLAKDVGEWKASMTMFTPDGELKSEGTAIVEMALGGRFQVTKIKANIMGMPFDGLGYQGYDNAKKVYTSIWMDNMGTSMTYAEGGVDKENDTLVYKGEMYSSETGKYIHYRSVSKNVSENHITFEMYMEEGGNYTRSFLIEYTR